MGPGNMSFKLFSRDCDDRTDLGTIILDDTYYFCIWHVIQFLKQLCETDIIITILARR